MGKRGYTHVQELQPEIQAMIAEGKTYREIAEIFGLKDKRVIEQFMNRERRKQKRIAAGIVARPKGRPRKDASPRDIVAEQAYELESLITGVVKAADHSAKPSSR